MDILISWAFFFALGFGARWLTTRKRPVPPTPEQRALMADHRNTVRGAIHDSYTAGYLAGKETNKPNTTHANHH